MVVIDDKFFVIGGRDGLKILNIVECYNFKIKIWIVLLLMLIYRYGLGKIFYFIDIIFRNIFRNSEDVC